MLPNRLILRSPLHEPAFRQPPHHDLRGDVGPGPRDRARSISARASRTIRARRTCGAKAADAVLNGYNQYPSMMGLPELRSAIAAHYAPLAGPRSRCRHRGHGDVGRDRGARRRDPRRWSSPATRWCCSSPCTTPICRWCGCAGGVPRFVTPAAAAFPARPRKRSRRHSRRRPRRWCSTTRSIPTATIFSAEDLALLADFCRRFDAIAICDEVWEHVVFDGRRHQPVLASTGMRERTRQDRLGGQDLQPDRLEGRLRLRGARTS